MTEEELAALKAEAEQAQEYRDRWLRLQAEFENTRKRLQKEQAEFYARASQRVLTELLTVVDDFDRALAAASNDSNPEHLREGIAMIHRRLTGFLKAHGVEPIASTGQPFDPDRHEAVEHVATADHPQNTVVEELRKGYTLHGWVIRPASVKVAVSKSVPGANSEKVPGTI